MFLLTARPQVLADSTTLRHRLTYTLSLDDLLDFGEFLDNLDQVNSCPGLAAQARRAVRNTIREYLDAGKYEMIARVCGRSWALTDEWEQELRRREPKM